jgi:hypothetical protein
LEKNKDDGGTPEPAHNVLGSHSGQAALRREKLESNHRENQATGKEGETDHIRDKHSPQKKKKGRYTGRLFGTNNLKEGAM